MPRHDSFTPLGDRAVVVHLGDAIDDASFQRVRALARRLEREPFAGLAEFVPAYTTVTVYYDPLQLALEDACAAIGRLLSNESPLEDEPTRLVEIPVCYGGEFGEDLEHVANHTGLTSDEVIRLHSSAEYRVHMLGFVPGFPYLGGMPPQLATPRRSSPRLVTPAGSVGIAGEQTGIYPLETPGGWQLIGRTPLRLFRPDENPPTLLRAGDRVRFHSITPAEYDALRPRPSSAVPAISSDGPIHVLRPGLLSTVQDLGRRGYQQYGVVVGGAMDTLSLRVANLLVGNDESAAALELTLLGPTLRFEQEALIAICGGDFAPSIDGASLPMHRPIKIRAGTTLAFGAARQGCRAYLAVAGGIDVPEVLGSRSTYLRAEIGGYRGRALVADDQLAICAPSDLSQRITNEFRAKQSDAPFVSVPWQAGVRFVPTPRLELRVIRGAELDRLSPDSRERLFSRDFEVSPQSDRMGYRLAGPGLELAAAWELISAAVCPGTLQLPPDGQPILLMADGATTGGYPKIAHVASVDLPVAAQLRPGDSLKMREISLEEAHNLYRQREAALRCLATGLRLKFT